MGRRQVNRKPMLPVPDGIDYVPVIIAGALIVLFSIEHIVAILRGVEVEPAWNDRPDTELFLLLILGFRSRSRSVCPRSSPSFAAGLPVAVVFQKMVGGMRVFFLAIPFFVSPAN